MKLISTEKKCPKCESALDIVLETPYFSKAPKKGAAKKPSVMDATGFTCSFCDSKWTIYRILFNTDEE